MAGLSNASCFVRSEVIVIVDVDAGVGVYPPAITSHKTAVRAMALVNVIVQAAKVPDPPTLVTYKTIMPVLESYEMTSPCM